MDRRKFLQNTSVISIGSTLFPSAVSARPTKKDVLKVVFLSDVHVKPTAISEAGMRKAFRHINQMKTKPDFILNGGDSIMDAMNTEKEKTAIQWNLWNKILSEENKIPIYHAIGNHDAWGWQLKDESVKSDPLYDKAWVIKEHNLPGRYYSFEKNNWKFIILDSAHENNGGYIAKIDELQFAWLEEQLKATSADQHICLVSHIPIVSFCAALFSDENQANGDWKISRALLHTDSRKLIQLFSNYKNIRAALSGHIHLQDAVEYKNVSYYCNGAVSGNWWNGAFKGFDPAFAQFDFNKDGTVHRNMIFY
jgi:3',5'-cyclic-AMP phosphodiesterase